jgi:hypothetical protein
MYADRDMGKEGEFGIISHVTSTDQLVKSDR